MAKQDFRTKEDKENLSMAKQDFRTKNDKENLSMAKEDYRTNKKNLSLVDIYKEKEYETPYQNPMKLINFDVPEHIPYHTRSKAKAEENVAEQEQTNNNVPAKIFTIGETTYKYYSYKANSLRNVAYQKLVNYIWLNELGNAELANTRSTMNKEVERFLSKYPSPPIGNPK
jgi:hypothetical protein